MNTDIFRDSILKNIEDLLKEYYGISDDLNDKGYLMDPPLTAPPFYFAGTDLYRLLMLVEERFSIIIQSEDIRAHGFRSINEIVTMIEKYVIT